MKNNKLEEILTVRGDLTYTQRLELLADEFERRSREITKLQSENRQLKERLGRIAGLAKVIDGMQIDEDIWGYDDVTVVSEILSIATEGEGDDSS